MQSSSCPFHLIDVKMPWQPFLQHIKRGLSPQTRKLAQTLIKRKVARPRLLIAMFNIIIQTHFVILIWHSTTKNIGKTSLCCFSPESLEWWPMACWELSFFRTFSSKVATNFKAAGFKQPSFWETYSSRSISPVKRTKSEGFSPSCLPVCSSSSLG